MPSPLMEDTFQEEEEEEEQVVVVVVIAINSIPVMSFHDSR